MEIFELRAFPNGEDRYKYFLENNIVAIAWGDTEDVSQMGKNEIKEKLKELYPENSSIQLSQTTNMIDRFKGLNKNDIILIPYKEDQTVTIAKVTKEYSYIKAYQEKHMAHQVGIKVLKIVPENELSESLRNTLKARLTLTKISEDKHAEILNLMEGKNYSKDILAYEENIKLIRKVFNKQEDQLVKKALLFSAFSLSESYLTEHIKLSLDLSDINSKKVSDTIIQQRGENSILKSLKYHDERKKLFKDIYHTELDFPTKKQQDLRNALAHDITSPSIDDDLIIFPTKSKSESEELTKLFEEFENYAEKIEQISKKDKIVKKIG